MSSSLVRSLGLLAVVASGIALAGCAPAVEDEPSASPSVTSTASAAPTATSTPSTTSVPSEPGETTKPAPTTKPDAGESVGIACDQLITLQQMYDFNSNISLIGSFTPTSGTQSAKVAGFKGLTCRWQQNSSGNNLDFSVAKLDAASLDALAQEAASNSTSVSTFGENGYFTRGDGHGTAQVFSGSYWIVAESVDFTEAGDVAPLMEAMLRNLP